MDDSNYFKPNHFAPSPYHIDLVLCIDGTSSMAPLLEIVKKQALELPEEIIRCRRSTGDDIPVFRVRVIVFRSYLTDGEFAVQMTDFYDYFREKDELTELINSITAFGGDEGFEDGLEALAYAMLSDWNQNYKGRHIIALWTDKSAHTIGYGKSSQYYDPSLPKDFDELTDWWGDDELPKAKMKYYVKRLALFAPKVKPWTLLASCWDNAILFPSFAGQGMNEFDYQEIVRCLVKI